MTSKRKQILKAIAVSGSATIDDLVMTTGLERKNLHDNVKATLKDELCQRIKDDVTDGWLRLAKEFECNNIPELRVFINAAVDKLDRLRSAKTDSLKNAHPEPAYSTDDAKPIYIIADNSSECVKLLRQFNEWRRFDGEIDEQGPAMPHPKSIGFAIDMAIRLIEERGELLAAAEAIEINAEECMDFDDCMAILVPIDDYHRLMEAIASAKGGA